MEKGCSLRERPSVFTALDALYEFPSSLQVIDFCFSHEYLDQCSQCRQVHLAQVNLQGYLQF
ncbi:MAG: hypothetical protein ABS69_21375 [Nitrosomonadales bacterium SCN 54-20]|jgi:hypothetical protein|nr:MAG: hypothetical protein ABS69_21375 [Nitrosomonadales bacterium SCN 54-20]